MRLSLVRFIVFLLIFSSFIGLVYSSNSYWIEHKDNGNYSDNLWVKINISNGSNYYYVYYAPEGNDEWEEEDNIILRTPGLIAYYDFDNNRNDKSGKGNDGVAYGTTFDVDRFGDINNSLYFDGNDDYYEVLNAKSLPVNPGSAWTMGGFFYVNSITANTVLMGFGDTSGADGKGTVRSIFYYNNHIYYWGHTYDWDTGISLPLNQWVHIIFTTDGSTIYLYVNGELKASHALPTQNTASNIIRLGGTYGHKYHGRMDDIVIYNRRLSSSEIHDIYYYNKYNKPNSTLVAYYKLDGDATDSSGNSNDGTVYGAVATEDRFGRSGKAMYFDGSDDYVELFSQTTPVELTVSLWVYIPSSQQGIYTPLIVKWYSSGSDNINIYKDSNDVLIFGYRDSDGSTWRRIMTTNFPFDRWFHIVAVKGNIDKLYINNILASQSTNNYIIHQTNGMWVFAKDGAGNTGKCRLDEVRIYNRALTESEIKQLYQETSLKFQDGDKVFEFFDDFDGTSLDTGKWQNVGGSYSISNSQITYTQDTGWDHGIISIDTLNIQNGYKIISLVKSISSDGVRVGAGSEISSYNKDSVYIINGGSTWGDTFLSADSSNYDIINGNYNTQNNVWYLIEGIRKSNNTFIFNLYDSSRNLLDSFSGTITYPNINNNKIVIEGFDDWVADYIAIAKYFSTEPSISYGSEETGSWNVSGYIYTKRKQVLINSNKDLGEYQIVLNYSLFNDDRLFIEKKDVVFLKPDLVYYNGTVHVENCISDNYIWYINDINVLNTSSSELNNSYFTSDDIIKVKCNNLFSEGLRIYNFKPVLDKIERINGSFSHISSNENITLNCSYNDEEGDGVIRYKFRWYVNGVLKRENVSYNNYDTLNNTNFNDYDNITFSCAFDDNKSKNGLMFSNKEVSDVLPSSGFEGTIKDIVNWDNKIILLTFNGSEDFSYELINNNWVLNKSYLKGLDKNYSYFKVTLYGGYKYFTGVYKINENITNVDVYEYDNGWLRLYNFSINTSLHKGTYSSTSGLVFDEKGEPHILIKYFYYVSGGFFGTQYLYIHGFSIINGSWQRDTKFDVPTHISGEIIEYVYNVNSFYYNNEDYIFFETQGSTKHIIIYKIISDGLESVSFANGVSVSYNPLIFYKDNKYYIYKSNNIFKTEYTYSDFYSKNFTIINNPPVINFINFTKDSYKSTENIYIDSCNYTDLDGDSANCYCDWYVNNNLVASYTQSLGEGNYTKYDDVKAICYADDGYLNGRSSNNIEKSINITNGEPSVIQVSIKQYEEIQNLSAYNYSFGQDKGLNYWVEDQNKIWIKDSLNYSDELYIYYNPVGNDETSIDNTGLVAYYKLEGDATDSSGNGNDGIVYGAVATEDRFNRSGKAMYFDGSDDEINIGSGILTTEDFTIASWIKRDGTDTDSNKVVVGFEGSNYLYWKVREDHSNQIELYLGDGSNYMLLYSTSSIPADKWTFVAVTFNSLSHSFNIYINGILDASGMTGTVFSHDLTDAIGKIGGYQNYFNGIIDEVRIYNRALTESEIKQLYKETSLKFQDGDKVFEFFDDFEGTSLDSNKWSLIDNSDTVVISDSLLHYIDSSSGDRETDKIHSKNINSDNIIIETLVKPYSASPETDGRFGIIAKTNTSIYGKHSWSTILRDNSGTKEFDLLEENIAWVSTNSFLWSYGTFYKIKKIINGTSVNSIIYDSSGVELLSINGTFSTTNQNITGVGLYSAGESYFDWIIVRKYSSTEPSITYGSEETGNWYINGYNYTRRVKVVLQSFDKLNNYQINLDYKKINDSRLMIVRNYNSYIIQDGPFYTDSNLIANCSAYDPDGDELYYFYKWYKNGVLIPNQTSRYLDSSYFSKYDNISVQCMVYDGVNKTDYLGSPIYSINNSKPVIEKSDIYVKHNVTNYWVEDQNKVWFKTNLEQGKNYYYIFYDPEGNDETTINNSGLIAYYKLEGDATDSSGNGNNGTVYGAVATEDRFGRSEKAMYFDGSDDYVDLGLNDNLRIIGDLTLSFWLYWDGDTSDAKNIITCSKSDEESLESNYLYKVYIERDNSLKYLHEYGAGSNEVIDTLYDVPVKKWIKVDIIRDTINKILYTYINGNLYSSISYSNNPEKASSGNLQRSVIGAEWDFSNQFFDGKIDEIRIYNRVLTESEIKQLYQETSLKFQDGDEVFEFFDDFDGTSLDSGKWSISDYASVSNSILTLDTGGSSVLGKVFSNYDLESSYNMKSKIRVATKYTTDDSLAMGEDDDGDGSDYFRWWGLRWVSDSQYAEFRLKDTTAVGYDTAYSFTVGDWYTLKLVRENDDLKGYIDGSLIDTRTYYQYGTAKVEFSCWQGKGEVDYVLVSKYTPSEVTLFYGSEETGKWIVNGKVYRKRLLVEIDSNKTIYDYQVDLNYSEINDDKLFIIRKELFDNIYSNQDLYGYCEASDADADDLVYDYIWYKNYQIITEVSGKVLNTSYFTHFDNITFQCKVFDGEEYSDALNSSNKIIQNVKPKVNYVNIEPEHPYSNNTLYANCSGSDYENDSLIYFYQWYKNGQKLNGQNYSYLNNSEFTHFDNITLECWTFDGYNYSDKVNSSIKKIKNLEPEVDYVVIIPSDPYSNDTLYANCSGSDYENDSLIYFYQWYKNGQKLNGQNNSYLNNSEFTHFDNITLECWVFDGYNYSEKVNSLIEEIKNLKPEVDYVNIEPEKAYSNNTLIANCSFIDYEGDSLTYYYQWYKNGQILIGQNNSYLNNSEFIHFDNITLECWTFDGYNYSVKVNSSIKKIKNVIPYVINVTFNASYSEINMVVDKCEYYDYENDSITYNYKWYVNDVVVDNDNILEHNKTLVGDRVILSCMVNDTNQSAWVNSSLYIIPNHLITDYSNIENTATNLTEIGDYVNFTGSVTGYGEINKCLLILKPVNSTFPFNQVVMSLNKSYNYSDLFTMFQITPYYTTEYSNVSYWVWCNDSEGNYGNSSIFYFQIGDYTKPNITFDTSKSDILVDGIVVDNINHENITVYMVIQDYNLFYVGVNISCENEGVIYTFEDVGIDNQTYIFNKSISIKGYEPQRCVLHVVSTDDHTEEYIEDYDYVIENNEIKYYTNNKLYIGFKAYGNIDKLNTRKLNDRYIFKVKYNDNSLIRKYEITSDYKLYIRKHSHYPVHFVVWNEKIQNGNWIDLNVVNPNDYIYVINKINDYDYEVILVHKLLKYPYDEEKYMQTKKSWIDYILDLFKSDIPYNYTTESLERYYNLANIDSLIDNNITQEQMDYYMEYYGIHDIQFNSVGGANKRERNSTFYIGGVFNITSLNAYNDSFINGYNVTLYNIDYEETRSQVLNKTNHEIPNVKQGRYKITITHPDYLTKVYYKIMEAQYDVCTQYQANESVFCNNQTGNYSFSNINDILNEENMFDNDTTTYAEIVSLNYTYIYVNYSVKPNSSFAYWDVYAFGGDKVSILFETNNKSVLQLRIKVKEGEGNDNIKFEEYNGTSWEELSYVTGLVYEGKIYEEDMRFYTQLPNRISFIYNTSQSLITFKYYNVKTRQLVNNYTIKLYDLSSGINKTFNISDGSSGITLPLNSNVTYRIIAHKDGFFNIDKNYTFNTGDIKIIKEYFNYNATFIFYDEYSLEPYDFAATYEAHMDVKCSNYTRTYPLNNETLGSTYDNVTNTTIFGNKITVPIDCDYLNIKFYVTYPGAESYYRTLMPTYEESLNLTVFLLDMTQAPYVYNSFILDDLMGRYENPSVWIKKNINGRTYTIYADTTDMEDKVGLYLIENNEYEVEIHSDNMPVYVLGKYSADVGGEKVISLNDINLANRPTGMYDNVRYTIKKTEQNNQTGVLFMYEDPENKTESVQFKLYLRSVNGTLLYSSDIITNVNAIGSVFVPLDDDVVNYTIVGVIDINHEEEGRKIITKILNKSWLLGLPLMDYVDSQFMSWVLLILLSVIAIYASIQTSMISIVVTALGILFLSFGWMQVSKTVLALSILIALIQFLSGKKNK